MIQAELGGFGAVSLDSQSSGENELVPGSACGGATGQRETETQAFAPPNGQQSIQQTGHGWFYQLRLQSRQTICTVGTSCTFMV